MSDAHRSAGDGGTARNDAPLLDPKTLVRTPGFAKLLDELDRRRFVSAGGLWGSAQALVVAALHAERQGPWWLVVSTDVELESFAEDLEALGLRPARLVSRGGAGGRGDGADAEAVRARIQLAQRLAGKSSDRPRVVVASLAGMLEPLPNSEELTKHFVAFAKGQTLDVEDFLARAVDAGYTRTPLVEKHGEVSLRGDILDVFPFAAEQPVRIELFDREIDSLRTFDPAEQRSVEAFEKIEICLASDQSHAELGAAPITLVPPTATWIEIEPLRIQDRAEGLRVQSSEHQKALIELRSRAAERVRLELQSLPGTTLTFDTRSIQALGGAIGQAAERLRQTSDDGSRIVVLCRNDAERHRFEQVLAENGGAPNVELRVGSLSRGFRVPDAKLVVVNHRELAGVQGVKKSAVQRPTYKSRALQSFFDLKPGDYVVHAVHGLAIYKGLELLRRGVGEEEHLHLVFADDVSLYVPSNQVDVVQRYIGSGKKVPPLDKIGSQSFRRRRERVERALYDLAGDLLEVQAKREMKKRAPWQGEPELVRDMLGSFEYVDTPDQATADREITTDLESARPMDRLLCGDVGFGKTEIAMRAAFRVAAAGGQVAMLVPTTVLAHQHTVTFRERLSDFPVRIEGLSRTAIGKEEKRILTRVANGEVDIVIGTHRLLSKDVTFKNLGLLIVDEEQRFGVVQKEHFKALRADVDVLTLSATPIPRTLHMSLSGLRDISALGTPPPGRQAIETKVVDAEDRALLRQALLAEKSRGGQVFFLHNRVGDIHSVARVLSELVPECSFAVGHGQMGAKELERVIDAFARGETDVLVATTIVENGLDIPAAGTIFIDQADHYGLSELHQLRGRVGRGQQKAYCYLLVERYKPLSHVSRERLKALEELNHLGAGFQISMKDLEIRGAGNILGPEQSGHIAAVGYDMYCRLLRQTVERMKAGLGRDESGGDAELGAPIELELGLRAFLPSAWIPSHDVRLEVLRSLDAIASDADAEKAEALLRDRFGRMPPEAEALLRSFRLRAKLAPLAITRVAWRGDHYQVEYRDRLAIDFLFRDRNVETRPIRTGLVHVMTPKKVQDAESALRWLEAQLQRTSGDPRIPATHR
ncbi:MAG: transcription-repair coupling factor [Planctomycetes bacterium]|nr:transcription-repair coupling factor [Planctomycetota bacterium]